MKALVLVLALFLIGCGAKAQPVTPQPVIVTKVETIEKLVPTPVQRVPPAALLEHFAGPLPIFVAPSDPAASSALTPEQERNLLALIEWLRLKVKAWEAWAATKVD